MARIKYYDPSDDTWKYADDVLVSTPVLSVNGKTGAVVLTAEDIGASGPEAVVAHNEDTTAHTDIRALVSALEGEVMLKSDISIKKAQLTLEDGTAVLIDVVVASDGTTIQRYTNQVPLSIGTDGNIFNGVGYQENYRLSSSGVTKALDYAVVTGYIPAKSGDVVRIYGCGFATNVHSHNMVCAYDSNFAYVGGVATQQGSYELYPYSTDIKGDYEYDADGNATVTLASLDNIAYIRVSSKGITAPVGGWNIDPDDMIVTINEEIV